MLDTPVTKRLLHVTTEVEIFGNIDVNLSIDKLFIRNEPVDKWHSCAHSLKKYLEAKQKKSPLYHRKCELEYFTGIRDALLEAKDIDDVIGCIDEMLEVSIETRQRGFGVGDDNTRASGGVRLRRGVRLLIEQARNHDLVLYPAGMMTPANVGWLGCGVESQALAIHRDLKEVVERLTFGRTSEHDRKRLLTLFEYLIGFTRFASVPDFTEEFFDRFWAWIDNEYRESFETTKTQSTAYNRTNGLLDKIFEALFTNQLGIDPEFKLNYERRIRNRLVRNKNSAMHHSFAWMVQGGDGRPDLAAWAEAFSWWLNDKPFKSPESLVSSTKPFIKWLRSLRDPPRAPQECSRHHIKRLQDSAEPEITYIEYIHREGYAGRQSGYNALNDLRRFFEQWHDEHRGDFPDWQSPIKSFDIDTTWIRGSGKTDKDVLPIRIIKMMKDLITENDYAWPRSLSEDYFDFYDDKHNRFENVWCPARSLGLLTLLIIPIRTIQMRLLDSGEADETIYDREKKEWIANEHPLAVQGRQEGFWKSLYDHSSQRDYVGIHITTNKTAVVTSAEFEVGYDIPWDCAELAPHIDFLIEWQKKYNPAERLMTRRLCTEKRLHPNDAIENLPGYTFLFRDRVNKNAFKDEPVTHNRLNNLFYKCLTEIERRLAAQEEPVQLIGTGPRNPSYTLHGLRAAGITHFVKAGVPIQVIAEFLSGHATILMTLHYAKFGPAYITDVLDKAQTAIDGEMEEDFLSFMNEVDANRLSDFVASNDESGLERLADTSPGLWSIGLDGVCPTGRAMCDQGGENLSSQNNPYYAPVPGGPRNCALCRFFITGPEFLNGQVVAFNTHVFSIGEKAKDLQRVKEKVAEAESAGKKSRLVERERNLVDALEKEIDLMLKSMQARFALIEKSRVLLHDRARKGGAQEDDRPKRLGWLTRMGAQEDIEVVLEHTSEWDLVDFVAHACELFPEKAEPSARLKKGKILDQFLKKNGYEALFYQLSDDEALTAGNKLTRFLQQKVGRDRLRSLMDGHETLRSLGIASDFDREAGLIMPSKPLELELAATNGER